MGNTVHLIQTAPLVDLALFLALFAAFILGMIQGAIRRVLGILSILAGFLLAANLREPAGNFLADNWTQFPAGYDHMLGFAIVFVVFTVVASIVIQGLYKRTEIYARRPIVDDLVGGALGVVEAVLLLTIALIILTSYTFPAQFPGELGYLRDIKDQLIHVSYIAGAIRDNVVPGFVGVLSILLPADLVSLFH